MLFIWHLLYPFFIENEVIDGRKRERAVWSQVRELDLSLIEMANMDCSWWRKKILSDLLIKKIDCKYA